MGAAFYDDEECIHCEMCEAVTQEELVAASNRIREYLKAHAKDGKGPMRKVTVCGKGGVGKSTTVNLIAGAFLEAGYRVLILDTDDSNPGLFRTFGFDGQPKPLIKLLSRFAAGEPEANTEWITREKIALSDIPSEYVLNRNGLQFMMVGKIENPFEGCACSMADLTRDLLAKLVLKEKEVAIVDMEAGLESFGRGVERSADTVLVIVEPSFESMTLAERIHYMAEGMGIQRVRAILNKVPSESTKQRMIEQLEGKRVPVIGAVFYDPEVSDAGFEGRAPKPGAKAMDEVKGIIQKLIEETTPANES